MFETVMKLIGEKKKYYIPMVKLKGSTHSNEARIRGLLPLAANAPIWLPKDNPHVMDAIDEFMRFPVSRHDDIATAIAYLRSWCGAIGYVGTASAVRHMSLIML